MATPVFTTITGEADGSPTETFTGTEVRVTRIFRCPWNGRIQAAKEILAGKGHEYLLSDNTIAAHTTATINSVFATSVSTKGSGAHTSDEDIHGDPVSEYVEAILTVQYEPITGEDPDIIIVNEKGDGRFISESISPTVEFLSMDHDKLKWTTGDDTGIELNSKESPGIRIEGMVYTVTLFRETSIPTGVLTAIGKTNLNEVKSPRLGLDFPAGTLLFGEPNITKESNLDNKTNLTVTYNFKYREKGWNKFFRAETGLFEKIYLDGSSTAHEPIKSINFTDLRLVTEFVP